MHIIFMLITMILMAGCDYTIALQDKPVHAVNPQLVGLWQRVDTTDQTDQLLILPLDDQQLLITYPADSTTAMFGRVTEWQHNQVKLMQITWIGNAKGDPNQSDKKYQYATLTTDQSTLSFRLLNPEAISPSLNTHELLQDAILDNIQEENSFRKPMTFKRIEKK